MSELNSTSNEKIHNEECSQEKRNKVQFGKKIVICFFMLFLVSFVGWIIYPLFKTYRQKQELIKIFSEVQNKINENMHNLKYLPKFLQIKMEFTNMLENMNSDEIQTLYHEILFFKDQIDLMRRGENFDSILNKIAERYRDRFPF